MAVKKPQKALEVNGQEIYPLTSVDQVVMPDGSRLGDATGGLPMPPTAEVGQYIRVSAVDDNGKVTATEAVTVEELEELSEVAF